MTKLQMQAELIEAGIVFEQRPHRETGKNMHYAYLDGVEIERSRYLGELIQSVYEKFGG